MVSKKYIILIFDGHGTGSDKGAVSGKFEEFEIVKKMCKATYDYLRAIPKSKRKFVVAYPEKDKQMTIAQQIALMKKYRKMGYIVIGLEEHMNSAAGKAGDGAEIWINTRCNLAKSCANKILYQWKKIGQNSRGVKSGDLMFTNAFIGNSKVASLITEFGFVNNPTDRKIFDTDAEIKKAGIAIGKALVSALKI